MAFLTKIKLSRITNLSDARYAAAAGMEYISFCFDAGHERFISPAHAKQIMDWLAGIECIGEFNGEPVETINEVCRLIGLHLVQLKGNYTGEDIKKINVPVLWEAAAGVPVPESVFAVQVTVHEPEQAGEWRQQLNNYKTILHFTSGNHAMIRSVVETQQPYAISFTGGDEEKPGTRDFSDLSGLLEELTTAD